MVLYLLAFVTLTGSYNAMVAFSVVFVLMDVHLKGLMRLVVLECVGFKRTEEDCGFLAISVRLASYIRPVIIGKWYFVHKSSF